MSKNLTKIIICSCEHSYQDKVYGKYKRLHNKGKSKSGTEVWVCTVCGNRRS